MSDRKLFRVKLREAVSRAQGDPSINPYEYLHKVSGWDVSDIVKHGDLREIHMGLYDADEQTKAWTTAFLKTHGLS
jgi:hypothetical protein